MCFARPCTRHVATATHAFSLCALALSVYLFAFLSLRVCLNQAVTVRLNDQITELEAQVRAAMANAEEQRLVASHAESKLRSVSAKCDDCEKEKASLRSLNKGLLAKMKAQTAEVEALKATIASLNAQVADLEAALGSTRLLSSTPSGDEPIISKNNKTVITELQRAGPFFHTVRGHFAPDGVMSRGAFVNMAKVTFVACCRGAHVRVVVCVSVCPCFRVSVFPCLCVFVCVCPWPCPWPCPYPCP